MQGNADGGTIYLAAGTYDGSGTQVASTSKAYLTLKAAPGVARNQVTLAGPGGAVWMSPTGRADVAIYLWRHGE